MNLEDIRTRPEKELMYRRGRVRNLPRFKKLVQKYNEGGDPLNLDDAVRYMGLSHHTMRQYAKQLGLRLIVFTDEDGQRWIAFRKGSEKPP
ncbi:MAG: hypothetical protein AM324_006045 [Candidatus Thorarchaeota archaeon SMTZ1-83]